MAIFMGEIKLITPFRTVITEILSYDLKTFSVFGRTKKEDHFFEDLLKIGCDFYEILELFANCNAIDAGNIAYILKNVPTAKTVTGCSRNQLRQMIPHWYNFKQNRLTINDLCEELKSHIENHSDGIYVYNSNANIKKQKSYNDVYALLIAKSDCFFL